MSTEEARKTTTEEPCAAAIAAAAAAAAPPPEVSSPRQVWGRLQRLRSMTRSYAKHQSISMEKMQSNHTVIVQEAHQIMSELRSRTRQPSARHGFVYDRLLARETDLCKTKAALSSSSLSPPSTLLESLRRTMYVVAVGGAAIIFHALNVGRSHVVYIGGRRSRCDEQDGWDVREQPIELEEELGEGQRQFPLHSLRHASPSSHFEGSDGSC